MESCDVLFVGGGPGGYTGAVRAAQLGKKVVLVEKEALGGTCLNRGCIPTKSIISSLKAAESARRGSEFGFVVGGITLDYEAIQKRKDKVVTGNGLGIKGLLKKWGVVVEKGHASFLEPGLVEINKEGGEKVQLKSASTVIATGSVPASLPLLEADGDLVHTSDTLHRLEDVPRRLLVIGGGAIGCEYAYIYNRLGSEVTIIEMENHLLPTEDEEIAKIVEREFKKKKIKILTGKTVERLEKRGGELQGETSTGDRLEFDKALLSVGRLPNSENLGLERVGVRIKERGGIEVNGKLETSTSGIYAIGDVTGENLLAYVASHEAIRAAENINAGGGEAMSYEAIPQVIFSEPEVGSVGLDEKAALADGREIKVGKFLFRSMGRSHASGELAGMAKVVCDDSTDKVIGVQIAGAHASEMVHTAVLAIKQGVTAKDWGESFFAHPVFSEALLEAVWDVHGKAIHKV